MNKLKVRPILVPYNIHEIQPKDCIGKIFLNENNVVTILNDLEDIIKSNAYFNAIPQELILISLEEGKIEVETKVAWCYDKDDKSTEYPLNYQFFVRKVVATQDQLSPELIQQLIYEYNNGGMKDFEIEMEYYWENYHGVVTGDVTVVEKDFCYNKIRPKLNNGFVCIVKKEQPIKFETEDKISDAMPIYTEEEVKRLYDLSKTIIYSLSSMISSYELKNLSLEIAEFENWFNQNKKK